MTQQTGDKSAPNVVVTARDVSLLVGFIRFFGTAWGNGQPKLGSLLILALGGAASRLRGTLMPRTDN